MPAHSFTPIMLCLLHLWRVVTPSSGHPQYSRCQLVQRTALCNGAELHAVPPGLPDDIQELQLNLNLIRTLPGGALRFPALVALSVACNKLEKLQSSTFQDTTFLESLNLAQNSLHADDEETRRAFQSLPRLRVLDLSENNLDEEMAAALLQSLASLEYLNLSGNLLQRLDETSFTDLHQLRELDLQRNIMFEIDNAFNSNHKLQRLNLAFNYLACLTDFHITQLLVFNASHNFIEWFISAQHVNETFQLETLDLSNNKLLFFPFLPNHSRLKNLYLSHNSVRFYQHLAQNASGSNATVEFYNLKTSSSNVTAQLWDDGLHGDISSLEILDLGGNQVEYFPEGFLQKMPALSRLRLNSNCLETLNLTSDQLSGSLYELDVSNNRLSCIVTDGGAADLLGNLAYLNLSLNGLDRVPWGLLPSLPSLTSVDLSYNNVQVCSAEDAAGVTDAAAACVDWRNIRSLRQLHLSGCNLSAVPPEAFAGLSLTHLELSDNPGLDLQDATRSLSRTLQHLGLGNTQIQHFDFSHFHSLRWVNLSHNALVQLPPSLLKLNLKLLDVSHNRLAGFSPGHAHSLARLHTLFLAGNPFNCCQADWFFTLGSTGTLEVVGREDMECEDMWKETHRLEQQDFLCEEEHDSLIWVVLFVTACFCFSVILIILLLSFKPTMLQKPMKKKCLKPTSY